MKIFKLLAKSISLLLFAAMLFVMPAYAEVLNLEATMDGSQEVPPVATTATGIGTFVLDTTAHTLSYSITFTGLTASATAAHIHNAPAGINGAVIFPLIGVPAATSGAFSRTLTGLTASQEADILAGNTYVNIHNSLHPGGEIRGQILRTTNTIPEFPAIALPIIGVIGLIFLFQRRKSK